MFLRSFFEIFFQDFLFYYHWLYPTCRRTSDFYDGSVTYLSLSAPLSSAPPPSCAKILVPSKKLQESLWNSSFIPYESKPTMKNLALKKYKPLVTLKYIIFKNFNKILVSKSNKILLVTNIPTPYRIPLFNELNKQLKGRGLKLKIIFGSLAYQRRKWEVNMSEWERNSLRISVRPEKCFKKRMMFFSFPSHPSAFRAQKRHSN